MADIPDESPPKTLSQRASGIFTRAFRMNWSSKYKDRVPEDAEAVQADDEGYDEPSGSGVNSSGSSLQVPVAAGGPIKKNASEGSIFSQASDWGDADLTAIMAAIPDEILSGETEVYKADSCYSDSDMDEAIRCAPISFPEETADAGPVLSGPSNISLSSSDPSNVASASSSQSNKSKGKGKAETYVPAIVTRSPTKSPRTPKAAAQAAPAPETHSALGKRKASDRPDTPGPSRPSKIAKPNSRPLMNLSDPEEPFIVAYDPKIQRCMDARGLEVGVQWEIARLVASGRLHYDNITIADLDRLKGPNAKAAPQVLEILLNVLRDADAKEAKANAFAREEAARSPWDALDQELAARRLDPCGALGFNPDTPPQYYGGNIRFGGALVERSNNQYEITLDPLTKGSSCRFLRRFGSDRIMVVKIPKKILNKPRNDLEKLFIGRALIVGGRVFRALYAKDTNVFFVEVDETIVYNPATNNIRVSPSTRPPNPAGPLSFFGYIDWFNPLGVNSKQSLFGTTLTILFSKWSTRFALAFSNSVPGIELDPSDILPEPDIVSSDSDMTDGCGYANKALLLKLRDSLELDKAPTAVQVRVKGAKGLLLLHPTDDSPTPRVWIRPSQNKINYPPEKPLDRAMCIVDVLRTSHLRSPARLSAETLVNFAENGVPHSVFVQLFQDSLKEIVDSLLTWEGPFAMEDLWATVARIGGVMMERRARENVGEARAKGYGGDKDRDDNVLDDDDEIDNAADARSTAWWDDPISGCPSGLEETVMCLLESGFTPQNCPVLREKLIKVIEKVIKRYVLNYRIDVPMSCTAFIVPDPYGVLGPDEIYVRSSHSEFNTADGLASDTLVGDVLITRHPCKVPTDTQKVRAVDRPELRMYTDVIVCSVQGYRRFADLLAGGDYDGDKAILTWYPPIVQAFRNADLKYSFEPPEVAAAFSCDPEKVADLLQKIDAEPVQVQIQEVQKYLLGAIQDTSLVGIYSTLHEKTTYQLGYFHAVTIRLAYMFCKVLDRYKSGLILRHQVKLADQAFAFNRRLPWKAESEDNHEGRDQLFLVRELPRFVMDTIRTEAIKEGAAQTARVQAQCAKANGLLDDVLVAPWREAEDIARRMSEAHNDLGERALSAIRSHVERVYEEHGRRVKERAFTSKHIIIRQDILRSLSQEFASKPTVDDLFMGRAQIARYRASYAYLYDFKTSSKGWSRFPWDVAMRDLTAIKADAEGNSKTITERFHARFFLKHSSTRRS
ncbi:hypothetical protein PLICRDRAFT_696285 [Plicaturopsis crispa FD-325 SS-3]|nr:hypothetical protein PLICRDRAFT_696285 [Plicaturopsis crispa FD-325 SS-3]